MTGDRNLYQTIFACMVEPAYVVDEDMRITELNPAFERFFGVAREELLGQPCHDVLSPGICASCLLPQALWESGVSSGIETVLVDGEGQEKTVLVSGSCLTDEHGENIGGMVIFQDITARKEAEQQLRDSEVDLAITLKSIGDAVISTDTQGQVVLLNAVAENLTGWTQAEAAGRPLKEIFHIYNEYTGDAVDSPIERVLREGIVVGLANHTMLVRRDGRKFPIADSGAPIRDDRGEIRGVVLVFRDMTEERKVQNALRESLLFNQEIISNAREGVIVYDRELRYVAWNRCMEELTGLRADQVLGQPALEAFPHLRTYHVDRMLARALTGETVTSDDIPYEVPSTSRSGWTAGVYGPHRDVEGNIVGVVGLVRDVTERHRLQDQLLQAQKLEAVGLLAGGVAHDFNNLLAGILGQANLLRLDAEPGSAVHQAARTIEQAADRGAELTRQLLGFARQGKNQDVPVDLRQVLGEVIGLLQRTIDKSIRIVQHWRAPTALVQGDPAQLHQIFMNLAVNARDAMPDGGELAFTIEQVHLDDAYCATHVDTHPGQYVVVAVADSGCGIPRELLERIFDPFFTTKGPGQGTGLGLATVYGIAKNHGGSVQVYSEPGHGSTFKVYLPVTVTKTAATVSGVPTAPPPGHGRILVVDDEQAVRNTMAQLLTRLGYEPVTVENGHAAVEYYRRHGAQIDAVIIDLIMPDMGGQECFRQLKALNPEVRAILSSGYGLEGKVQEILNEGLCGFIPKPFHLRDLAGVIQAALTK